MIGDFVSYLPGNVQDLSLPGSRAAFRDPHTSPDGSRDWEFMQSIGQEAGRYAMSGPLPGRYYGRPWFPPGVTGANWLAGNSGAGYDVGSSIYSDMGPVGAGSDMMGSESAVSPAASVADAQMTGQPLGPVTLTTPMPSVLQPRNNQVTAQSLQPCKLAQWVNDNPLPAVGAALVIFFLLRGGRK